MIEIGDMIQYCALYTFHTYIVKDIYEHDGTTKVALINECNRIVHKTVKDIMNDNGYSIYRPVHKVQMA